MDAIVHEQYYPAALFNDVALLFLAQPLDLGPEADVVCLPRPDQVFDGSRCFATGWGKDQFGIQDLYLIIAFFFRYISYSLCRSSRKIPARPEEN